MVTFYLTKNTPYSTIIEESKFIQTILECKEEKETKIELSDEFISTKDLKIMTYLFSPLSLSFSKSGYTNKTYKKNKRILNFLKLSTLLHLTKAIIYLDIPILYPLILEQGGKRINKCKTYQTTQELLDLKNAILELPTPFQNSIYCQWIHLEHLLYFWEVTNIEPILLPRKITQNILLYTCLSKGRILSYKYLTTKMGRIFESKYMKGATALDVASKFNQVEMSNYLLSEVKTEKGI